MTKYSVTAFGVLLWLMLLGRIDLSFEFQINRLSIFIARPSSSLSMTSWARSVTNATGTTTAGAILCEPNVAKKEQLTSFLLLISYDGSRFTGWSAANDGGGNSGGSTDPQRPGFVRSVQGILRNDLAKLYGNVDPERIVIEGCSRTDKGVHARGMVAQVYCLTSQALTLSKSAVVQVTQEVDAASCGGGWDEGQPSIPGKRLPHPRNATDATPCFTPLRLPLSKVALSINRMNYDCSIMATAPSPPQTALDDVPFHPTRSAKRKTYHYTLSVGPLHDPSGYHCSWHVRDTVDWNLVEQAVQMLSGTHDFTAFQGASRGVSDRRRRREPVCCLEPIVLMTTETPNDPWYHLTKTRTVMIAITGDRFLYKMVRFIVGALVAVGINKITLQDLEHALETGKRPVFACAPARGLVLHQVEYDVPIEWQTATS